MARNSEAKVISRVRRKRNYNKVVLLILLIVLIPFTAVEGILIACSHSDREVRTDYLVILGAGLWGETPSPVLKARLSAGLLYLKKYPDTKVVVSGAQGRGEALTEAEAMRRYLVSAGIDESRILSEDCSTSTMENFQNSMALIRKDSGKQNVAISFVTSEFHIFRAKMLANRNHLEAYAISCNTPRSVILQLYAREFPALIKSFVIDW